MLAKEHIENDAVDLVVGAVEGDRAHSILWRGEQCTRLTVPVHAAFALLVPSWVPTQVVMHNCIEVWLKVDSLAEAIGTDENPLIGLGKLNHSLFALSGWQGAGDG